MGVSFSYPLLLRETRGKIRLVEVKQQQLVLERQNQERFIRASIEGNYQNWIALEEQIRIQEQQVKNARLLRDAEQTRFFAGESSFFLVNTREVALINAEIKLQELYSKYAKVKAELYWSAGQMPVQ
jgi:outer membrane protein TolC